LLVRSVQQTVHAEQTTTSLTLAQGKLEQLRAAAFGFDGNGVRIDDALLTPSPANALTEDTPPYLDGLDRFGQLPAAGMSPAFVRRWSIRTHRNDPDTLELAVCVNAVGMALPQPQCVWTIRTRRP